MAIRMGAERRSSVASMLAAEATAARLGRAECELQAVAEECARREQLAAQHITQLVSCATTDLAQLVASQPEPFI